MRRRSAKPRNHAGRELAIDPPGAELAAEKECAACRRGPTGVQGHQALFVEALSGTHLRFACADCGQRWSRPHAAPEGCEWRRIAQGPGAGLPLPPRRTEA
jgi:hypothetical protein